MDYEALAEKFLHSMFLIQKSGRQKRISESIRGETFVLFYIHEHGGSAVPGEISEIMNISSARIAAALNSLDKKGLITRQIDPSDRRRILVELTQKGKDMAEEHRRFGITDAANMLNLLGENDAHEFVRITAKLANLAQKSNNT